MAQTVERHRVSLGDILSELDDGSAHRILTNCLIAFVRLPSPSLLTSLLADAVPGVSWKEPWHSNWRHWWPLGWPLAWICPQSTALKVNARDEDYAPTHCVSTVYVKLSLLPES